MSTAFAHLRLHSEYSLCDSVVRIADLIDACARLEFAAVAVTDHCNLFAMVKFYRAAVAAGIKPVVGADLWLDAPGGPAPFTLLCQDRAGYRNLSRLLSRAYLEGVRTTDGTPLLAPDWLQDSSDGLIALSGGAQGELGRALLRADAAAAGAALERWRAWFPERFYLEIARTGRPQDAPHLAAAVRCAAHTRTPVVAANDVRFLAREEFEAHETRVCIQQGRVLNDDKRPRAYSPEQYLKSAAEMAALFADLPAALANSVEIAQRCSLQLEFGANVLPDYPLAPGEDAGQRLLADAKQGLAARLAAQPPAAPAADYQARLLRELGVIVQMGFAGYFLIVADFIAWARRNGVPVGPGRGSGAGSLVAYALGITDLDPLRYELLFERFLNPERVSMPDFDIDFCMDGRDRVIEYVAERYGRARVAQIITHGSMAARAVVRDVGRALGHPYGFVDRIARLIPMELGVTLDKALADEEELQRQYEQEEDVRALLDRARMLEGLARNAGRHAGGVVIAPAELTEYTPLYCEPGEGAVTQLDKDDVEAIGLVKFDFLGLRTLTLIDHALRAVNSQRARAAEAALDIARIPLDDGPTYALLKRCATTAVFQLESRGMRDLIRRLQPDCFDDVVALVALFRPGPLQSGMVDDFIDRKHGRAAIVYPHPELEAILKPTYGVILYQEQVMQIAQVLAGYTLGGADLLRRAMGKKKAEEMAKQRAVFASGATGRGVDADLAGRIFDLMEKFAGYGFNKSHSAAYALLAYQTAWLKSHHPDAFMAAVLSSEMGRTDKLVELVQECRALNLTVLGPDINASDYPFTVAGPDTLRYGLGAIKGVGEAAVQAIVAERGERGIYTDLADLCRRVDSRRLNRRALEALIRAGALDAVEPTRAGAMVALDAALASAQQYERAAQAGQVDMFGAAVLMAVAKHAAPAVPEWPAEERLAHEYAALGLYLSGHPVAGLRAELDGFAETIAALTPPEGEPRRVVLVGLPVAVRSLNTQRGRMAFVTLDDGSGRIEVAVFAEQYDRLRALTAQTQILVVEGQLARNEREGGLRISADRLLSLDQARAERAPALWLDLTPVAAGNGFLGELAALLKPHCGGPSPVLIEYRLSAARGRLRLGADWCIHPREDCLRGLRRLLGPERVRLRYRADAGRGAAKPERTALPAHRSMRILHP